MKLRSVDVRNRPIQQWPGEFTADRAASRFKASWSSTRDLLDRELYHLNARNVVLQQAYQEADYRLDGGVRANARVAHPGVIISLDSSYGPLSYPCDRFTDWQDNIRAIALALEALRKVDRYGVTRHGEQYTGWKQLGGRPMPTPMTPDEAARFIAEHGRPSLIEMGGWDVLKDPAYASELALVYRHAARALHPDTGGTTEDFQRLQEAKRVLDGAG